MKSTLKTRFTIILLVVAAVVYAQPKSNYYTASTLDGKNGRELELALKAIVNPHTKLGYNDLWAAYKTTDAAPIDSTTAVKNRFPAYSAKNDNDMVYDMYAWMGQFPKFYTDNDHTQTGGINREHCVPNSWWGGESGNAWAYTDLHHLVPADGCCNSAKSNYPLGEYQTGMSLQWPRETKTNTSGYTYVVGHTTSHTTGEVCSKSASHVWKNFSESAYGSSTALFEPADEYKGDFARMYLYVVCTYEGDLLWQTTDNTMFSNESGVASATYGYTLIADWARDLLLKWHRQDPVSDKERTRNNAVEGLQNNRNPFIDYPELVEYIWGDKSSMSFSLANAKSAYSQAYRDENSTGETPAVYDVIWMINGELAEAGSQTTRVSAGERVTVLPTAATCGTRDFIGWTTSASLNGSKPAVLFANAEDAPEVNHSTTYYAVFGELGTTTITKTDVINQALTGVTTGTYSSFEDKVVTGGSGATYAGLCAGSNSSVQLRSDTKTNYSGVITTGCRGNAKKVSVVWESHTTDGRTIDIYGKNTAYTSAADLYSNDEAIKGTKLGSITYNTSSSNPTELTISGDYAYIGIRSNSGALYLTSISIDWEVPDYEYYYTTCSGPDQFDIRWEVDGNNYTAGNPTTRVPYNGQIGVLPTPPTSHDASRIFMGWTRESEVSSKPTDLFTRAREVAPITESTTYHAVFATVRDVVSGDFVLVEEEQEDWSGEYLIVYNGTYAMNTRYGNKDANTYATYTDISAWYDSHRIAANETTEGLVYQAAKTTNGYSLYCVSDNSYLGLSTGTTETGRLRWNSSYTANACDWNMGINEIGNVGSSTLYIRWNNNSGSYRFATYANNGQQEIELYRREMATIYRNYSLSSDAVELLVFTITWQNYDGTTLLTTEVDEGDVPVYTGETPTRPASAEYTYTFCGWDPTPSAAKNDYTYTAQYAGTPNSYRLTWNVDGAENSSSVAYGDAISQPATPTKTGYVFDHWTPTVEETMPAHDVTYTAVWTSNVRGMVYAGTATALENRNLVEFNTIRQTYPNAIMIVDQSEADHVVNETNVIVDYAVGQYGLHHYECRYLELKDNGYTGDTKNFYSPVDFHALAGSYNRSITANSNTFCVPFDMKASYIGVSGAKLLTFAYYEPIYEEGVATGGAYAYFSQHDELSAGIPCFVYSPSATVFTAEFENEYIVCSPENSGNMKGTFVRTTEYADATGYYGLVSGGMAIGKAGESVAPFRCVLSLNKDMAFNGGSTSSAPERLEIRIIGEDGMVTELPGVAIEDIERELPTYSIDGKIVGEISAPGLYIVNGKVVFINK